MKPKVTETLTKHGCELVCAPGTPPWSIRAVIHGGVTTGDDESISSHPPSAKSCTPLCGNN